MNYISLGYFCSVAIELERFGIREESSPFDWLISGFKGVISAIEKNFEDFLTYDYLSQDKKYPNIYRNTKYDFDFYHDFNPYSELRQQLPDVQAKYSRRIQRFYESIRRPTLFIRYISDESKIEGKPKELIWIEDNYDYIITLLKSFNSDNDILFIANEGVTSDKIKIYNVKKDKNDTVARQPFSKNTFLFEKFNSIDFPNKERNIKRYKKKYGTIGKMRKRLNALIIMVKKRFIKEYTHEKQH